MMMIMGKRVNLFPLVCWSGCVCVCIVFFFLGFTGVRGGERRNGSLGVVVGNCHEEKLKHYERESWFNCFL